MIFGDGVGATLVHAVVAGDDPHEVPEQSVQRCMFSCLTPSPMNLMTLFLDDFFDKSLSYMLAVWPCQLFLCLGPRCRPVLERHCPEQLTILPGIDNRTTCVLGFL